MSRGDIAQLIESASDASLTLIPAGDRLRVRGTEPVLADDLVEDLRRWKPAILDHLREDAERRRQAAVWDACDRLAELYRRAGKLSDWLTPAVKTTEAAVERFWIEARRTDDGEPFHRALEEWEGTTTDAIIRAASRGANNG